MNRQQKQLLVDLLLSRHNLFRYVLAAKALKKYFPILKKETGALKTVVVDNARKKPLQTMAFAALAGFLISKLLRK